METSEVVTKTKWSIDPAHSEIGFKVKHLMFSNVKGRFKDVDASIHTTGDDFSSAEIDVRIKTASVDAEQFKEISFTDSKVVATDQAGHFTLSGDLTMKGIKRRIDLNVEFGALIKDPWGAEKALFNITGKINRKDWELNYNAVLEAGGVLISEDVWINCEVQLIKKA